LHSSRPYSFAALSTALGLFGLIAWDWSGGDLALARLMATPTGFTARDGWFLTQVMHAGGRAVAGLLVVVVALALVRPFGPWRSLSRGHRLWLLAAVIGGMLLPATFKRLSDTSCPWDLAEFGGTVAWVSHWQWWQVDGGPGHCFPAGHASAGFAWIAGYFAWPRGSAPSRLWLWGGLAAGLALGLGQQLRGAHFMSHTLWTAWICWTWAWGLSLLLARPSPTQNAG
jgi:membrane-associated PAP2 superfamily phosphatase